MSQSKHVQKIPLILVVDDDRLILLTLEAYLLKFGYKILKTQNGQTAKELINKHHKDIDVILLDRVLPDIDGITLVKWIKSSPNITQVPIIMQTGSDQPEQIQEGIDAGVFYYLTKPIEAKILQSVVSSAVKESMQRKYLRNEMKKHQLIPRLMDHSVYRIKNLNEAETVSLFLAYCFPNPEGVLPGIAALIINGIEHGKCSIKFEEKSKLIESNQWRDEIDNKCNQEDLKHLYVKMILSGKIFM